MNYKELLEIGFKRKNGECDVWEDQHGYPWFWLEFKLGKRMVMEWSPDEPKYVIMYRLARNGGRNFYNVRSVMWFSELESVTSFIKFWKNGGTYGMDCAAISDENIYDSNTLPNNSKV